MLLLGRFMLPFVVFFSIASFFSSRKKSFLQSSLWLCMFFLKTAFGCRFVDNFFFLFIFGFFLRRTNCKLYFIFFCFARIPVSSAISESISIIIDYLSHRDNAWALVLLFYVGNFFYATRPPYVRSVSISRGAFLYVLVHDKRWFRWHKKKGFSKSLY